MYTKSGYIFHEFPTELSNEFNERKCKLSEFNTTIQREPPETVGYSLLTAFYFPAHTIPLS
jgi:hypothetical protein